MQDPWCRIKAALLTLDDVMLRIILWLAATFAAVTTTVVLSCDVQAGLKSSSPYPANAAALSDATRETLVKRLSAEPLQAAALRELAVRQDTQLELLQLSHKVSRRDPLAQLLLIERASGQGDVAATLNHYAVLLAISPGMQRGIINLLGSAAREPEIFSALRGHKDQTWFPAVMKRMVAATDTGEAILDLLKARPLANETLTTPDQIQPLIALMLAKPDPQHAFALIEPQRTRNPALGRFEFSSSSLNERFAPLTWKLAKTAAPLPADDDGSIAVQVTAAPNIRTRVAERFTDLNAGPYRLTGSIEVHNAPKLQLQWAARCKGKAASVEIIRQTTSPFQAGGQFEMAVTIPEGCLVQHWQLAVLGDDARLPSVVTIKQTRLESAI